MKLRDRLFSSFERAATRIPLVTAWLWLPCLVVAVYASVLWAFAPDFGSSTVWGTADTAVESASPEILAWIGQNEPLVLTWAMTVFGVLYRKALKRGWRAKEWLSIATWSSVLAFLNLTLAELGMPNSGPYVSIWSEVSFGRETLPTVLESVQAFLIDLVNLRWLLVIGLFAVIMELHRARIGKSDTSTSVPIGGRWKPLPALALAAVGAAIVEGYSPFLFIALVSGGESGLVQEWIFAFAEYVNLVVVWFVGMAIYAWKSGAFLTVDRHRLRVSLAGTELGLFTIPWRRVLRLRELTVAGNQDSIVVFAGVLPWFRARFAVHSQRDGDFALMAVREEALRQGVPYEQVAIRRGASVAGWTLLLSGLALAWLVTQTVWQSAHAMAESSDLATDFAGTDHFVLLGALTAGAALFLGLGCGFLFARTDGAMRALPLIGVAVAAAWLPDPQIYWLVYIAIYAILIARLGPVETVPAVPFPDVDVAEFGMWLVGAKALFGVGGYVMGLMIAVKPWYRALPSFPYRLPWSEKRSSSQSSSEATVTT